MKLPTVTQAFILHFTISLAVFCALVAVMALYWFPGNLFFLEGGLEVLKIIAPIDLVLGPALTLALYRPWKKNIRFDMSVIVAIQVVALGYGVHTAYTQRTAAIVFAETRFETLTHTEFKEARAANEEKGRPTKSIQELGGEMPVIVYAQPFHHLEYNKYLEDIINGGLELRERSDRYRLLSSLTDELDEFRITEDAGAAITEIPASSKPASDAGVLRFPLKGRYGSGEIVLDPGTFEVQEINLDDDE